jgi:hypothetical protein
METEDCEFEARLDYKVRSCQERKKERKKRKEGRKGGWEGGGREGRRKEGEFKETKILYIFI